MDFNKGGKMKASDLEENITNINASQSPIKNVEAAFARISRRGDYLGAHPGSKIPQWLYTMNPKHNNDGYQNHFQGIQRLQDKNYVAISGGDWKKSKLSLFIIKMGSRPKKGPWWSNIVTAPEYPQTDLVVAAISLDDKHWHAGGMDVQGDILAVPIEYSPPHTIKKLSGVEAPDYGPLQSSSIMFFDLKDPEHPKKFPLEIKREETKAGAVALTRLQNGYFLVAAWTDSDKAPEKPARLEFYLFEEKEFNNEDFQKKPDWTWYRDDEFAVGEQERNFSNFQSINFILQEDGQLYLVGLHNSGEGKPVLPFGKDYADLYVVEIHKNALKAKPVIVDEKTPKITKVANLNFECKNRQCNFDAGAGVYIHEGELFVYSVFHFRGGKGIKKGIIKFNEYLPPYKGISRKVSDKNAWIEMFEKSHFQGRRAAIRGTAEMTQPNFDNVKAENEGIEDEVSSIRFQLPQGTKCLLYKHKDYKGKQLLELNGTGEVDEEYSRLKDNETEVSSMEFKSE